ncbi:hypothetical protein NPIL_653321 [Nephila pilipes]|uniref:C2H2-type domain-containing protein n=1 Tax=Nephila pilipes TaxID=299642 RepID=A0A8X6UAK3_NEPPI|nr:hypothetical protein NPIL_653321 [Nephila pilipes]
MLQLWHLTVIKIEKTRKILVSYEESDDHKKSMMIYLTRNSKQEPIGKKEKWGSPYNGSFTYLMEFISKFNVFFKEHLIKYQTEGIKTTTYLSTNAYEEILQFVRKNILKRIIEQINGDRTKYHPLIEDSRGKAESVRQLTLSSDSVAQNYIIHCKEGLCCRIEQEDFVSVDIAKIRMFSCSICGKEFNRNDNLKVHERIHTGQGRYKCLNFFPRVQINSNSKLHKYYTCQTCGKEFRRSANLRVHERIHSGQKPFKCPYCAYEWFQDTFPCYLMELSSFSRSKTQHPSSHNSANSSEISSNSILKRKSYRCPNCSYTAKHLHHLKEHVIYIHTRNFPFVCSTCGRGFTAKHRLKTHRLFKNH